ncbi:glucokinase [Fastidiosibacter lacustris]|uniref:glucokinase n=1 Tax=Fastidiosibacter lacustris TaxID=2056695 RepID=UPI000E3468FA|nr:glucokinase [Fastidiosibacter lacustris]
MIVLSGDVGGTNTRLQITEHQSKKAKIIFAKKYLAAEFKSLSAIIEQFLAEATFDRSKIQAVCIAVAGPVKNGAIEFTNLPWGLTENELAEVLCLDKSKVRLINDFTSIGYGLDSVEKNNLICLQKAEIDPDAPIAMVGAGTGIGMGIVTKHNGQTLVYPSEGGHQDFAPVDDEQIGLFQFLKKRLHRVSIERICCGPGLINIYKYVVANPLYNQPESPELKRDMHKGIDHAQLITQYALEKGDPMALRAVDIFIRVYGAVAGDMALVTLPKGGLYIVGGIAPKIITQMQDGRFMKTFQDKGRLSGLMKEIPIFVVMDTDVGIKGAAEFALSLCKK